MKQLLLFVTAFIYGFAFAQNEEPLLKPGRVIFYNVENLFDTIDNPKTLDNEFLPLSKKEWNTQKYQIKVNHISKVLSNLLDTIQPLVIGLAEVENKQVLEDLIAQPLLKKYNLGIIHYDSPDERGIDVAIIYNKDAVQNDFDATLKVELKDNDKTRDIVYFKAYISETNPVWFFINHWPSRYGGAEVSNEKRITAAKILQAKIEDILSGDPSAHIVIMGDFNDEPNKESVKNLLVTTSKNNKPLMENLMTPLQKENSFTLRYKGQNEIFDQFIVSKTMFDKNTSYHIRNNAAYIFSKRWLLFNDNKYGLIPNRTYVGNKWVGGYSDHLPIYFDIVF